MKTKKNRRPNGSPRPIISEGYVKKGGQNGPPTTPKPEAPPGQAPTVTAAEFAHPGLALGAPTEAMDAAVSTMFAGLFEPCPLTDYQLTIVAWASRGKSNAIIAGILSTTEGSIEQHWYRICDRIGCPNRTAVVGMAIRKGWIQ